MQFWHVAAIKGNSIKMPVSEHVCVCVCVSDRHKLRTETETKPQNMKALLIAVAI